MGVSPVAAQNGLILVGNNRPHCLYLSLFHSQRSVNTGPWYKRTAKDPVALAKAVVARNHLHRDHFLRNRSAKTVVVVADHHYSTRTWSSLAKGTAGDAHDYDDDAVDESRPCSLFCTSPRHVDLAHG